MSLVALGPALGTLPGYDVERLETHHNGRWDAPSGTALTLLDRITEYREFEMVPDWEGIQPRGTDEVRVLVRWAGDIWGEHEVVLADNNESPTLTHHAGDRGVFAAGALDAVTRLVGRDPDWYSFEDVVTADGSWAKPVALPDRWACPVRQPQRRRLSRSTTNCWSSFARNRPSFGPSVSSKNSR